MALKTPQATTEGAGSTIAGYHHLYYKEQCAFKSPWLPREVTSPTLPRYLVKLILHLLLVEVK